MATSEKSGEPDNTETTNNQPGVESTLMSGEPENAEIPNNQPGVDPAQVREHGHSSSRNTLCYK